MIWFMFLLRKESNLQILAFLINNCLHLKETIWLSKRSMFFDGVTRVPCFDVILYKQSYFLCLGTLIFNSPKIAREDQGWFLPEGGGGGAIYNV